MCVVYFVRGLGAYHGDSICVFGAEALRVREWSTGQGGAVFVRRGSREVFNSGNNIEESWGGVGGGYMCRLERRRGRERSQSMAGIVSLPVSIRAVRRLFWGLYSYEFLRVFRTYVQWGIIMRRARETVPRGWSGGGARENSAFRTLLIARTLLGHLIERSELPWYLYRYNDRRGPNCGDNRPYRGGSSVFHSSGTTHAPSTLEGTRYVAVW